MRTVGFSVPGAELYPGFTRRAYAARIARESKRGYERSLPCNRRTARPTSVDSLIDPVGDSATSCHGRTSAGGGVLYHSSC